LIALLEAIEVAVQEADRPPPPESSDENLMHKWHQRLRTAASEEEVVVIVGEYIATLSEGDIARLPDPCKPRKIENADDIRSLSFALVRHNCISDGASARLVTRLSEFFSRAEVRLTELKGS
jgi:hypothetical protein